MPPSRPHQPVTSSLLTPVSPAKSADGSVVKSGMDPGHVKRVRDNRNARQHRFDVNRPTLSVDLVGTLDTDEKPDRRDRGYHRVVGAEHGINVQ
jgi:hypothetical protein